MTPIGTLSQKIQCQSIPCVMIPSDHRAERDRESGEAAVDADDHPALLQR